MMKRLLLFFLFSGIFGISLFSQYVSIEGRQFKDENGNDFYPVVCNYLVDYFYNIDDTNSFFASPEHSCDGWGYECNGTSTCDTQFYHNFIQIKHMGFNAIRLFCPPVYIDTLKGSHPGFRIDAIKRQSNGEAGNIHHQYYLNSPYESDWVTQNIFNLMDRILVQAYHAGLKVILLTGGAKYRFYPALDSLYVPYLSALSYHITHQSDTLARKALMAYDLFNEPSSSNQTGWPWNLTGHTKKDICDRVANWYNALKI